MKRIIVVVMVLISMVLLVGCSDKDYYTKEEVNEMIKQVETDNICDVTDYGQYTEEELNIIISQLQQRIEDIGRE